MHLEENVSELVDQPRIITAHRRVSQFIGLLKRMRNNRPLILLAVPGAIPAKSACQLIQPLKRG